MPSLYVIKATCMIFFFFNCFLWNVKKEFWAVGENDNFPLKEQCVISKFFKTEEKKALLGISTV